MGILTKYLATHHGYPPCTCDVKGTAEVQLGCAWLLGGHLHVVSLGDAAHVHYHQAQAVLLFMQKSSFSRESAFLTRWPNIIADRPSRCFNSQRLGSVRW